MSGDLTRNLGHADYGNKVGEKTDVQSTGLFMLIKRSCEYIILEFDG